MGLDSFQSDDDWGGQAPRLRRLRQASERWSAAHSRNGRHSDAHRLAPPHSTYRSDLSFETAPGGGTDSQHMLLPSTRTRPGSASPYYRSPSRTGSPAVSPDVAAQLPVTAAAKRGMNGAARRPSGAPPGPGAGRQPSSAAPAGRDAAWVDALLREGADVSEVVREMLRVGGSPPLPTTPVPAPDARRRSPPRSPARRQPPPAAGRPAAPPQRRSAAGDDMFNPAEADAARRRPARHTGSPREKAPAASPASELEQLEREIRHVEAPDEGGRQRQARELLRSYVEQTAKRFSPRPGSASPPPRPAAEHRPPSSPPPRAPSLPSEVQRPAAAATVIAAPQPAARPREPQRVAAGPSEGRWTQAERALGASPAPAAVPGGALVLRGPSPGSDGAPAAARAAAAAASAAASSARRAASPPPRAGLPLAGPGRRAASPAVAAGGRASPRPSFPSSGIAPRAAATHMRSPSPPLGPTPGSGRVWEPIRDPAAEQEAQVADYLLEKQRTLAEHQRRLLSEQSCLSGEWDEIRRQREQLQEREHRVRERERASVSPQQCTAAPDSPLLLRQSPREVGRPLGTAPRPLRRSHSAAGLSGSSAPTAAASGLKRLPAGPGRRAPTPPLRGDPPGPGAVAQQMNLRIAQRELPPHQPPPPLGGSDSATGRRAESPARPGPLLYPSAAASPLRASSGRRPISPHPGLLGVSEPSSPPPGGYGLLAPSARPPAPHAATLDSSGFSRPCEGVLSPTPGPPVLTAPRSPGGPPPGGSARHSPSRGAARMPRSEWRPAAQHAAPCGAAAVRPWWAEDAPPSGGAGGSAAPPAPCSPLLPPRPAGGGALSPRNTTAPGQFGLTVRVEGGARPHSFLIAAPVVQPESSVAELRRAIAERAGCSAARLWWSAGGRELRDGETVRDAGLRTGDVVAVTASAAAPAPAAALAAAPVPPAAVPAPPGGGGAVAALGRVFSTLDAAGAGVLTPQQLWHGLQSDAVAQGRIAELAQPAPAGAADRLWALVRQWLTADCAPRTYDFREFVHELMAYAGRALRAGADMDAVPSAEGAAQHAEPLALDALWLRVRRGVRVLVHANPKNHPWTLRREGAAQSDFEPGGAQCHTGGGGIPVPFVLVRFERRPEDSDAGVPRTEKALAQFERRECPVRLASLRVAAEAPAPSPAAAPPEAVPAPHLPHKRPPPAPAAGLPQGFGGSATGSRAGSAAGAAPAPPPRHPPGSQPPAQWGFRPPSSPRPASVKGTPTGARSSVLAAALSGRRASPTPHRNPPPALLPPHGGGAGRGARGQRSVSVPVLRPPAASPAS